MNMHHHAQENRRRPIVDPNLVGPGHQLPDNLRLIDTRPNLADGLKSRVVSRAEAVRLADDTGLSLLLINADGVPPVYKLLDYGRYKFEEDKRQRESKRKQRENTRTTKEIYMNPGIGDHDVDVKIKQIRGLIDDHDVKLGMKLNRSNKFKLTGRYTKPLHIIVQGEEFVINRVIRELGEEIAETRVMVTDNQVYAILRKRS